MKPPTSTARIYAQAQRAFSDWCGSHQVADPGHEDVARYLRYCLKARGPSTVPVHLSAIADMFRAHGMRLDTKAPEIQSIVQPARNATRGTRDDEIIAAARLLRAAGWACNPPPDPDAPCSYCGKPADFHGPCGIGGCPLGADL